VPGAWATPGPQETKKRCEWTKNYKQCRLTRKSRSARVFDSFYLVSWIRLDHREPASQAGNASSNLVGTAITAGQMVLWTWDSNLLDGPCSRSISQNSSLYRSSIAIQNSSRSFIR